MLQENRWVFLSILSLVLLLRVVKGTVVNTTAVNSHVKTEGNQAEAGIGGGLLYYRGKVDSTTAVKSSVKTSGSNADAGIGGGGRFTVRLTKPLR